MTKSYLVDTSAWVEYLRATESDTDVFMTELLTTGKTVATTEPVIMEVLAGARRPDELAQLERLVNGLHRKPVDHQLDYHAAASIYRAARSSGKTIRKLLDCLIAAVALRTDAILVHNDRDFDHIAAVMPRLRTQRHNRG